MKALLFVCCLFCVTLCFLVTPAIAGGTWGDRLVPRRSVWKEKMVERKLSWGVVVAPERVSKAIPDLPAVVKAPVKVIVEGMCGPDGCPTMTTTRAYDRVFNGRFRIFRRR